MLKDVIRDFDDKWLNKSLRRFLERGKFRVAENATGFRFVTMHRKNVKDTFSLLCDKYGSDKGEASSTGHPYAWPSHTYADLYSRLFSHCRNAVRLVFECGIGTNNPALISNMTGAGRPGASLRVWRDYFPNAMIYGADIDRDILFEEERIRTFYIDQLDQEAVRQCWRDIGQAGFDLMIDDGLHSFPAGKCLFENSVEKLSDSGIYVVEDVTPSDLARYVKYFEDKPYAVDYVTMYRPQVGAFYDNNMVIVRKL